MSVFHFLGVTTYVAALLFHFGGQAACSHHGLPGLRPIPFGQIGTVLILAPPSIKPNVLFGTAGRSDPGNGLPNILFPASHTT